MVVATTTGSEIKLAVEKEDELAVFAPFFTHEAKDKAEKALAEKAKRDSAPAAAPGDSKEKAKRDAAEAKEKHKKEAQERVEQEKSLKRDNKKKKDKPSHLDPAAAAETAAPAAEKKEEPVKSPMPIRKTTDWTDALSDAEVDEEIRNLAVCFLLTC